MTAYLVDDRVVCEACARALFGPCDEHEQPALDCGCADWPGPTTHAAGQAAIVASRNPDGTRTCGACGRLFRAKAVWCGGLAPDDPVYGEPPVTYFTRP